MEPRILTADAFVATIFACLKLDGVGKIADREAELDTHFAKLFASAKDDLVAEGFLPTFSFRQNEYHKDSPEFREALNTAARARRVSIENPVFRTISVQMTEAQAQRIFDGLPPGLRKLREQVRAQFKDLIPAETNSRV